jgi:hypothetical protein
VPGEDERHEGDDAMSDTRRLSNLSGNEWPDALRQFLDTYFPQCENAAIVIEPGGGMPPLVVPIAGVIPSCIDCISWLRFSGNYTAAGC